MTIEEICKIMEKAKELGIKHFSANGVSFYFRDHAHSSAPIQVKQTESVPETKADALIKPLSPLDEMSPEEILFYATPYYDELQAQKEEHAKKLCEAAV